MVKTINVNFVFNQISTIRDRQRNKHWFHYAAIGCYNSRHSVNASGLSVAVASITNQTKSHGSSDITARVGILRRRRYRYYRYVTERMQRSLSKIYWQFFTRSCSVKLYSNIDRILSFSSGRTWYFSLCVVLQLETGYTLVPFRLCEKFYQVEGEALITIHDPDAERRYYTVMWLW